MTELEEQIKVVIEARETARKTSEAKKLLYDEWQKQNGELLDSVSENNHIVSDEEAVLRALTLQAYAETGDKAPAVGVGIRERTVLTYDGKVAFDWAKAHKMALKLDSKAFEKIAKADPPDFVKITTEPQATIATELKVE